MLRVQHFHSCSTIKSINARDQKSFHIYIVISLYDMEYAVNIVSQFFGVSKNVLYPHHLHRIQKLEHTKFTVSF